MDGLAFAICAATITAAVCTVYIYRANLKVDWTKFEDVVAERCKTYRLALRAVVKSDLERTIAKAEADAAKADAKADGIVAYLKADLKRWM